MVIVYLIFNHKAHKEGTKYSKEIFLLKLCDLSAFEILSQRDSFGRGFHPDKST